jgi:hypothetical protein
MALRVQIIFWDKNGCESLDFCGANSLQPDASVALKPHEILLSGILRSFNPALPYPETTVLVSDYVARH